LQTTTATHLEAVINPDVPSVGPSRELIYLDNAATTPNDPRVVEAMMPYLTTKFGNPSAITYAYGVQAREAVEEARHRVARMLGASDDKEVIFTSGATEANFLAIVGSMTSEEVRTRAADSGKKVHIVTSLLEHSCVLNSCRYLEQIGVAEVTYLSIADRDGVTRAEDVKAALRPNTALVSIMLVNNEIGVVNEIDEISKVIQEHNGGSTLFHVDGTNGIGKIPLDVSEHSIHFLSCSAHKIYGPKGVGALYIHKEAQKRFNGLVKGGGQESGFRGGTENVPGIVGMGVAAHFAREELESDSKRLASMRDRALERLRAEVPAGCQVLVTGSLARRVPGNLHFAVPGCDSEELLAECRQRVAFSSGSACSASKKSSSYVMRAMGVPAEWPIFRLGFGRFNTQAEVDEALDVIIAAVRRLFDQAVASTAQGLQPLAKSLLPGGGAGEPDKRHSAQSTSTVSTAASLTHRIERSALDSLDSNNQSVSGLTHIGVVENRHQKPIYIEWKHERSKIILDKKWATGLDGLNEWSHVHILWLMGGEETTKTSHVPQGLYDQVPKVGIFSCRCPQRPNKIAVTLAKLISVNEESAEIEVEGLDAISGSPVLDIKPYVAVLDDISLVRRDSVVLQPGWNDQLQY
jgi:cysteine desulfurase